MNSAELNEISRLIVHSSIVVHKELGPGLLESVYDLCLSKELMDKNLTIANQVVLPIYYKGQLLNKDFRIDILVENEIIVELKAVEVLLPVHTAQVISYLKLSQLKLGFLINFNVPILKQGLRRYVNNF